MSTFRLNHRLFINAVILALAAFALHVQAQATTIPYLAEHESNLQYVNVAGDTVAYLDYGPRDGRTLLLLHGIPTSSLLYRDVAPAVALGGYRVIAPDLLGFGASAKPLRDGAYTLDAHAERLFALADALGVETFVLGLHDIGGMVGWRMVAQDAARIDGLIVADTLIGLEGVTPSPLSMPIMTGEAAPQEVWSALDTPEFAAEAARTFLVQGFSDARLIADALVEAYASPLTGGSSASFTQFFEGIGSFVENEPARRETLAAFDKPVTVIFGEQDKFFDVNVIVPDIQATFDVPDERVTVIEDAGHYVQEQAPAQYTAAVLTFMDEAFAE